MSGRLSPSRRFLEELLEMDGAALLHGPDHDPGSVYIDPIMAAPFETALADFCEDSGLPRDASRTGDLAAHVRDTLADVAPVALVGDARLVAAPARDGWVVGIAALTPDDAQPSGLRISGLFTGATLCVDPQARGVGIGGALALTRMLHDEGLPTWDHDEPGYSPAGAAVIEATCDDLHLIAEWALGTREKQPDIVGRLRLDIETHDPEEAPACL